MKGIYERDYTILTDEEVREKNRIDKENEVKIPRTYGEKNSFLEYPKAVRHHSSLFPNNYMDIKELQDKDSLHAHCDDFEGILEDRATNELAIKRFIQSNGYYHIPASLFSRFNFGHHEAVLFKEFQLGTDYKADYLLAGRGSGGWQFVFVEYQKPYGGVTLKNGEFGDEVRKGIKQIKDWMQFLEENYSTVNSEFMKYSRNVAMPVEFVKYDSTRMHYAVVVGRRNDFEHPYTRREQRRIEMVDGIKIIHYDNLLEDARGIIGKNSY